MKVIDGKFVYDDMEFYVVKINLGTEESPEYVVSKVCYNDFNNEVQYEPNAIPVEDNQFTIDGKTYTIVNGDRIAVYSATSTFSDGEFKCDIVNDRFKMDGIWYFLVKTGG